MHDFRKSTAEFSIAFQVNQFYWKFILKAAESFNHQTCLLFSTA